MMLPEQQRAMDYLAKKGTLAPVSKLREQARDAFAAIERVFDEVPAPQQTIAPAPGNWSPIEILDHLVLSHEPAIDQFASLLEGVTPPPIAVPAGLQSPPDQRASWTDLRLRLGNTHRELLRLLDEATDDHSLEPKAMVEMVVKVNGTPMHWLEPLDWKAFIQAIRVHTIEHRDQLDRAIGTPASSPAGPAPSRRRGGGDAA